LATKRGRVSGGVEERDGESHSIESEKTRKRQTQEERARRICTIRMGQYHMRGRGGEGYTKKWYRDSQLKRDKDLVSDC